MRVNLMLGAMIMLSLLFAPIAALALEARTTYSCSDGILEINKTKTIYGLYVESFENITCPMGCADNGIMCNSPENVNKIEVVMASAVFLVMAAIFFFLAKDLMPKNRIWYFTRYVHMGVSFGSLLLAVYFIAFMYSLGPNNVANMAWTGFYILFMTVILTFFAALYTEIDEKRKELNRMGKKFTFGGKK